MPDSVTDGLGLPDGKYVTFDLVCKRCEKEFGIVMTQDQLDHFQSKGHKAPPFCSECRIKLIIGA